MSLLTRACKAIGLLGLVTFLLLRCGREPSSSTIDVSDVEHTPVKRQSIGNCWIYATSTWAESLHLSANGETLNLSESYWTYRDWYDKLIGSSADKIDTSGSWSGASLIIARYGYMLEGEFLPDEADIQMSEAQRKAERSINQSLKSGSLKESDSRTPENVMNALDKAFGVDLKSLKPKIHPAEDMKTGVWSNGVARTLKDEINGGRHGWRSILYPQLYGKDAKESRLVKRQRVRVLNRVLRAVNQRQPVIMSSMVEFAALNTDNNATFEYDLYLENGTSEGQGGHLIVLEDYVVDNVPGIGKIGEGDVSPELKEKALLGEVEYLVVKNSWGTNRPDRGLSDGYTRFEIKYLNNPLPFDLEDGETDISKGNWYSPLSSFIIPPEF